ncbi:MAG: Mur ligase family protein, partial [bacterium]|nr:Mur ligase family protein [bacterium]
MLQKILRMMAVLVLKKYKPKIVGITGSVGKTSTKEAIFSVLESKFRVRRTNKNYNNEIGLPLTIIGADSGEDSL